MFIIFIKKEKKMNYFYLQKICLTYIIVSLIIIKINSDDCLINSIPDLKYPKLKTLFNGYHIMVSVQGIFSINPGLTKIEYSYIFTESQKFTEDVDNVKNTINQVEISQFSNEEGGKEYVVIYASNYIYFLNEYGKLKFYQELEKNNKINTDNSINLVAYKYKNGVYSFILEYNDVNIIMFYYYIITKETQLSLNFSKTIQYTDFSFSSGLSCQVTLNISSEKILTCVLNVHRNSDGNDLNVVYNFEPEQQFSNLSEVYSIDKSVLARYFKSSVNSERNYVAICYSVESPDNLKCFNYNVMNNTISDIFLTIDVCSTKLFGFNINYFEKPKEYVFSCLDNQKSKFSMKRISYNFTLIKNTYNTFENKNFDNCYTLDFFSIIYISKYQQYSLIVNSNCQGGIFIRTFLFSNTSCIEPALETTELQIPSDFIETTVLQIPSDFIETTELQIPSDSIEILETTIFNFKTNSIVSFSTLPKDITKNDSESEIIFDDFDKNYTNYYNICDNYYYFDENNNYHCTKEKKCPKNYFLIKNKSKCIIGCKNDFLYNYAYNNGCYKENYTINMETCPEIYPYLDIKTNVCIKECNIYDFLVSECITDNENEKTIENNINKIKNEILNSNNLNNSLFDDILKGVPDITIYDKNTKYQISSNLNQNLNNYTDISNIKLGECENVLKQVYKNISENDSLLIFKVDFYIYGYSSPIVEYEIYHPKTKEILDLKYCENNSIYISKPASINENKIFQYDPNNNFYNDICSKYTTDDYTDITLNDRYKEFIKNNYSLCENDCNFSNYDYNLKKVICKCDIKLNFANISDITIEKFKSKFYIGNLINIKVMKCYKKLFEKDGLIKNIGSYILLVVIFLYIICLVYFIIKGYNYFINRIKVVINNRNKGNKINEEITQQEPKQFKKIKSINKIKTKGTKKKVERKKSKKELIKGNKKNNRKKNIHLKNSNSLTKLNKSQNINILIKKKKN